MTNTLVFCLIALFCCTDLSFARQVPKECAKGPTVWCQSLKRGAECGAVGHCTSTVWEKQSETISHNDVANKFVRLFRQLKDVRELINEDYLASRVASECKDLPYPAVSKICKDNTAYLQQYINHVLQSETSPETMCRLIGMCNNKKVENILSMDKKKPAVPKVIKNKEHLLGSSQCTWGPSYWCSNFSTGRECKATHHCVSKVWPNINHAEDTDSICKICTDMVQQARDQLQSNETQEELKEVFEGSCKLIPIKVVASECMRLADDFVPELVETLASQMNPQQVCSVAGLCNSARIDEMLEEFNTQLSLRVECNNCQRTVGVLRKKFDETSYEDFLVALLQMCRKMSSLSDSCSMLVFKYYENIIEALKKDLTAQSVCHVSGQCTYKFHQHDEFTFPAEFTDYKPTDDVPCELCEQLVKHLRDVMVANTTEIEFYRVLKGLCKQTGNFKDECLHLAEQYYPIIYKYLVEELKANELCAMIGVCANQTQDVPIAPLVSGEIAVKAKLLGGYDMDKKQSTVPVARVPVHKQTNVRVMAESTSVGPLPIERMFVSVPAPQGKAACSFCQYFLHYLQVEISDSKTEDEIFQAVDKACDKLPHSVNDECKQFVTQYGPAVVALLVQRIDPATICPALGICPQVGEVRRVDINSEKSNCPLCLFAVEQLETMLKNNRTEQSIRTALDNLCTHLSTKLRTECVDFVDTYAPQLIEMLVANMDAQEICVFLKLCKDEIKDPLKITQSSIDKFHEKPQLMADRNNFRGRSLLPTTMLVGAHKDHDIETNEIFDNTVNGREIRPPIKQKTVCVICEFVLKEIDDQIKDKHNEDEVKHVIENVCKRMPKNIRSECEQFVDKYADMVISLLAQELDPEQVCEELKLCDRPSIVAAKEEILDCAVCEAVVMAVRKVLSNDKVDRNIVHIIEKSCELLPAKYNDRCHSMMEIYGDSVIHLIEEFGTKGVCQKIGLCSSSDAAYVHMYREKRN